MFLRFYLDKMLFFCLVSLLFSLSYVHLRWSHLMCVSRGVAGDWTGGKVQDSSRIWVELPQPNCKFNFRIAFLDQVLTIFRAFEVLEGVQKLFSPFILTICFTIFFPHLFISFRKSQKFYSSEAQLRMKVKNKRRCFLSLSRLSASGSFV